MFVVEYLVQEDLEVFSDLAEGQVDKDYLFLEHEPAAQYV